MSGLSLPVIPGATPRAGSVNGSQHGGSRPGSAASGNYTYVPQVYFSSTQGFKTHSHVHQTPYYHTGPSPRPQAVTRSYNQLPSLRHHPSPGGHTSRSNTRYSNITNSVRSRYSARHRRSPGPFTKTSADSPYLPTSQTEDCLKCLLKVRHKKCESHKYIRVGGGYRHGYWYIKCLLEEMELQRKKELARLQRLEAIKEHRVKAIKTYIRTKSGRLVERIVFLSEEDYAAFKEGKNIGDILKKYLTADEAKGLESWDKDEVVAVTMKVRTKSGRIIDKIVYVSKEDYEAIKAGKKDAKDVLSKYAEEGEAVEGWGEAKMRTIKTYVRTKSGRMIEKTIMISEEDYQAMIKDGKDPAEILKKYIPLEEGQTIESWQSGEPMKAIKTKIRTKSGRIIEKTIFVSADDYERMMEIKQGRDPNAILQKYLDPSEGDVQSWEKVPEGNPMKVVKTYIRTKSGRLVEKTVMMSEEDYNAFVASGGDPNFLKKFITLNKGEVIEDWEKASTVYSADDDPEIQDAAAGQRIVGKDGTIYEVYVDPVTGKKYKKKVGQVGKDGSPIKYDKKGRKVKVGKNGAPLKETGVERSRRKQGKRDKDSDSDFSYRSVYSAGGTRRVRRRRKRADGTYSGSESYHSSQDEDGQARRRRRRRQRAHGGSAHSYYSVVSAGGTRHVRRKKKRADGTYSASESYHSSDSDEEGGGRNKKKKQKKRREHGSDSDYSYASEVSAGGTRRRTRTKRIRDAQGRVIGHGAKEDYTSGESISRVYTTISDGKGGKIRVKKEKPGKGKKGKKGKDIPDFSDASTDSEAVDLSNMTEEEKKKYFEEKAKRKAEREKRRREKYGDKYDEMMAAHEKFVPGFTRILVKKDIIPRNSVFFIHRVTFSEVDPITGRKKKKNKKTRDGEYEYEPNTLPNKVLHCIRTLLWLMIFGSLFSSQNGENDGSGSEYEYEYDENGNLIKEKKKGKVSKADSDDGNYFEVDEKGEVKLRAGKKKIDLSKLTDDDLRRLGIDPTLSKQEIARRLKEKFGSDIEILDGKDHKIGTRRLSDYGSSVDTDDLANDSDLDVSTLKGTRRVNVLMKRGGQVLQDHLRRVIDQSKLDDDRGTYAKDLDERDGDIDFLSHYRLVNPHLLESYARAFVVEDEDFDTVIMADEARQAIDGVASVNHITEKQLEYVLKVLKIDDATQVTFRMFAVISALCERVTQMDLVYHLMDICVIYDITATNSNFRSIIDLRGIGCSKKKTASLSKIFMRVSVVNKIYAFQMCISFLDYICYIPLFLSMHDNIVDNPLDMASNKYDQMLRKPSGLPRQRDHNPLGNPLSRDSAFQNKQVARDLLQGKISLDDIKAEKQEIITKYSELPSLLQEREPTNVSKHTTDTMSSR
ncbi:hypothetical protein EGW08_006446 [Elysia chlorotica]|uniref:Uncharacterized protein n=1 Tax=Elysia chlorotica TaxID=188477 RepID=A0A3S1BDG9_ELYCH|nr:hypothetical protein EGW08_006446 [Elysia chlorotica]